jgi:extracellular elastinolytic metalloproteinase
MGPLDLRPVWDGFAKRGLGAGAVAPAPDSSSFRDLVESFQVPDDLPGS